MTALLACKVKDWHVCMTTFTSTTQALFRLVLGVFLLTILPLLAAPAKASDDPKCDALTAAYKSAWRAYDRRAATYWRAIEKKKTLRKGKKRKKLKITAKDYVITHPPVYSGPKPPKCMAAKKPTKKKTKKKSQIGTVADFLAAAKREYNFVPRATNEQEYKHIFAAEALSAGLTEEQVVGVYALETGGIGPYYRQSGIFPIDYKCNLLSEPKGRPASTALGYAQLLAANSNAMVKINGRAIAKRLEFASLMTDPNRKSELQQKAKILRKMVSDVEKGILRYKNRNNWREFVSFSKTSKGYAIHSLILDPDIGPLLQVYKLKKIVEVAKTRGFDHISAAQLETMNLVGYGRGLEMMTPVASKMPTANFFTRGGYSRNPVAKNLTAAGLVAKIGEIILKRRKNCGALEFTEIFNQMSANNH